MEPFFVRCETCQAQLRVREQRFVGEIHPCPKCNSMVLIAAPATMLSEAAEGAELAASTSTTASVGLAARLAGLVGRHAVACSVGAAAVVVTGSVAVTLFSSPDESAVAEHEPVVAVAGVDVIGSPGFVVDAPTEAGDSLESVSSASPNDRAVDNTPLPTAELQVEPVEYALTARLPGFTTDEPADPTDTINRHQEPVPAPPANVDHPNSKRTLRLDPLENDSPHRRSATTSTTPDFRVKDDAPPSDVAARLAFRIESIDMRSVPLKEFVELVSTMAAVPIEIDSTIGVSPQLKVAVQAKDVTLETLLEDVLAEHDLATTVRDGGLLVTKRSRP